jgi:hypothetical protein
MLAMAPSKEEGASGHSEEETAAGLLFDAGATKL